MSFHNTLIQLTAIGITDASLKTFLMAATDPDLMDVVIFDPPESTDVGNKVRGPNRRHVFVADELVSRTLGEMPAKHLLDALHQCAAGRHPDARARTYALWIYLGKPDSRACFSLQLFIHSVLVRKERTKQAMDYLFRGNSSVCKELVALLQMQRVQSLFNDYRARQIREYLKSMG
jgi:hypothetical protein